MSEDWQVGDIALCVSPCPFGHDATRRGRFYTVAHVGMARNLQTGLVLQALHLREAPHALGGSAPFRFVKVSPEEADEFDRETIALMNGTPTKQPA